MLGWKTGYLESKAIGLGHGRGGFSCHASSTSSTTGTLVEGQVADQPLDVFIAGDDPEAKQTVAQLVRDGGLRAIDVGPLERARQLEGLGFIGITLQQPLGLNFQSAWKLIS